MLTALSIRDVVLIEALDLEFGPGLGVLTGETGAGKSILLDSLGLALGSRADSGLIRHGAAQAVVTATFEVAAQGAIAALLAENGLELEPGEPLIVRRILRADRGSRAFLNDQPASATLLREVARRLVEIHGQHDDQGLLNPRGHRALLDSFGRLDTAAVAVAHQHWREAENALAAARAEQDLALRDREWLEHSVAELTALAPQVGEEERLAARRTAMQCGEKVTGELQAVAEVLDGSDGAISRLRQAARTLERVADADPALGSALEAIDRALIEAGAAREQVDSVGEALAFDPMVLERDEARLFDLRGMARKHRVQPDELPALAEQLTVRLAAVESGGAGIARLTLAAEEAHRNYSTAAQTLSAARTAAASRLDLAVAAELLPLRLDAARFRTVVEPLGVEHWGAAGCDRVEFEVSTNPGAPFAPLIKIASGGELSRFILALKVALAEEGSAHTLVFDEIDRGVGCPVANAIGERLARLAASAQVLVVTHSPQVAARGSQHLLIAKAHDGLVTRTGVTALDPTQRREEIARMLSGARITDEARAQAGQLLQAG